MKNKKQDDFNSMLLLLMKVEKNLGLTTFCSIFGNDKDGEILYNRFQDKFKRNVVDFYNDLCTIDQAKFFRHIQFVNGIA